MEDDNGPGDHDTSRQKSPRHSQKVVRVARGGAGKEDNADWLAISWGGKRVPARKGHRREWEQRGVKGRHCPRLPQRCSHEA